MTSTTTTQRKRKLTKGGRQLIGGGGWAYPSDEKTTRTMGQFFFGSQQLGRGGEDVVEKGNMD